MARNPVTEDRYFRNGIKADEWTTVRGKDVAYVERFCRRCGGAGGSEQWRHTGWRCYDCGGTGGRHLKALPVYTSEKIAKLDASLAKRRAKKVAKAQAERDARRDAFLSEHGEVLAVMRELEDGFLASLVSQAEANYYLTDKQWAAVPAAVTRTLDRMAERQRATSAPWAGEVGDAIDVEGVVHTIREFDGYMAGTLRYMTKIVCDSGAVLVYWGNYLFDRTGDRWQPVNEGDRVALRATVKERKVWDRTGEKQTIVSRPRNVRVCEIGG